MRGMEKRMLSTADEVNYNFLLVLSNRSID